MSEQKVPRSVEQRIVIKFLFGENVPSAEIHHRLQQHYGEECLRRRHSSPYCCWSLWWISADGTFSPKRNLITMRRSTLRGTFCSLITLATPRQDWTGSNPSRREGGDCGFTLSRSHSCCAVRLVYTQISPGHIWTTLYFPPHCGPGVDSTSKGNEYLRDKGGRYVGLSTLKPSYADCLEMWEPKGLSRPLMGLFYIHLYLYIITSVLKTYMEMIPVNIITRIRIRNFRIRIWVFITHPYFCALV